jgi:pantoate--beta-alanine ligase
LKIVETLTELRKIRLSTPIPLGFVPTMGYLHEGHLSLVERARNENSTVVTSIFVNPTQFGPHEDFDSYPRDITRDLDLLENQGADLAWVPKIETLYPPNFQTWVTVEHVTKPLEGIHRSGHFRGVTTIVVKLFNAVQPDRAYFGQKDAQQTAVIQQMVRDLNFPIEIVVCPTVREPDGLAMSSRNSYLNPAERIAAPVLYRGLLQAKNAHDEGERNAEVLRRLVRRVIDAEPLANIEYISFAHPNTLEELEGEIDGGLLSLAVRFGKTRLIDNIVLGD